MANYSVHIAISKRYAEKNNNIKALKSFFEGTIVSDLSNNKNESH